MYNSDHTATECIGQKIFFSSLLNQLMSSLDSFIQLCDQPEMFNPQAFKKEDCSRHISWQKVH